MGICPLCNALEAQVYSCQSCLNVLQDYGKVVDYTDAYSAYMDQDLLIEVDGLTGEDSQQYCVHVFYCGTCGTQTELTVKLV
ncbi:hypothetical protein CN680_07790 [Bacillus pseudomycoides]|uniref:hypothetical protein n=1 Tax=Bacillus pseudomycoides TaxID=64104 RepID=UPI000BEBABFF|nr:hypothetical protein [Bacillus pseudomycoides]PED72338.1 hypothetical protein CON97_09355 [Bacillus pseudomycoides]PEI40549.1 hypothetical protein CN620_14900 [Bacillus pseudomycoides]PEJ80027.1 hypothetical protein CN680_07790 [Bacillus pseudomycoides]PEM17544.1 hypothetical protein CN628_10915 [Bacillus pseudomycoides]PEO98706.1 hypothetical protein CN550_14115 [Bacillus pseudomycoides]